jgi:hypothetical protein
MRESMGQLIQDHQCNRNQVQTLGLHQYHLL